MITINEIADIAGVSRGTVDRALNNRPGVSPKTAERIRKIADDLCYQPDSAGRMLAARKKNLRLALLILHGPSFIFFDGVLQAARRKAAELEKLGVTVDFYLICQPDYAYLEQLAKEVENSRPDGIVILPTDQKPLLDLMDRLSGRGVPIVFFNVDAERPEHLCYVGCDYEKAGRMAAGLVSLCVTGGGEVAVATSISEDIPSFKARMKGFVSELKTCAPELAIANGGRAIVYFDPEFSEVERLLERNKRIRALYVVNPGDFQIFRAAQKAAGRRLPIITNDLVPSQQAMLREGVISATITQNPELQGTLPLQILYDYLVLGRYPEDRRVYTELNICIGQSL